MPQKTLSIQDNPLKKDEKSSQNGEEEKVEEGLQHLKKDPKFDPEFEDEAKNVLRNYYAGGSHRHDQSQGNEYLQPPDTNNKMTLWEIIALVSSHIIGRDNAQAFANLFKSDDKTKPKRLPLPGNEHSIQEDPLM